MWGARVEVVSLSHSRGANQLSLSTLTSIVGSHFIPISLDIKLIGWEMLSTAASHSGVRMQLKAISNGQKFQHCASNYRTPSNSRSIHSQASLGSHPCISVPA